MPGLYTDEEWAWIKAERARRAAWLALPKWERDRRRALIRLERKRKNELPHWVKHRGFHRKLRKLGFESYRDYLKSDHWARKRDEYRRSGLPQWCIGCNDKRFQLHHRSYTRLGAERLTDLIPLCRDCHRKVHDPVNEGETRLQHVHVILRRIFGWSRAEMNERFAPFGVFGNHK